MAQARVKRSGGDGVRYFGWYPRRRGILEHLERGTVSLVDIAVHDFLCLTADHKTGVAWASAEKIHALAGADISLRSIQRSLAKMERLGWLKRFCKRGRRGNYPIVLGRYFVRDASLKWFSVNLERTNDWRQVQFDPVTDPSFVGNSAVTQDDSEAGSEASPIQEGRLEISDPRKQVNPVNAVDEPADSVSVCAVKSKGPWKFIGVVQRSVPSEFKDGSGFAGILWTKYNQLKTSCEEDVSNGEKCVCSPLDFVQDVRMECKELGVTYPPVLLKREIDLEAAERAQG